MKRTGMTLAAVPPMAMAAAALVAAPAAAEGVSPDNDDAYAAAQTAVDHFGACTINVEEDDHNGEFAWEVELNEASRNAHDHTRIEAKVQDGTVVDWEADDDSADEECDAAWPAANGAGGQADPIADFIDSIDVFGSLGFVEDLLD